LDTQPGGKGLNQAIAAVRLGCSVEMVGRIGSDAYGVLRSEAFDREGIGRTHVSVAPTLGTGLTMIVVDATGENRIVVNPAANMSLTSGHIVGAAEAIRQADALMLSFEVPDAALVGAADLASPETLVCLNAAPARLIPADLAQRVDVLIVNETEAMSLGATVVDSVESAQGAADSLQPLARKAVVVTLGEQGAVFSADNASGHAPGFAADVLDTTGAGDAFCAALTFGLVNGLKVRDAVALGNAAGSLAVRALGATSALPDADAVWALVKL
jgi:ribokinase